MKRNPVRFSVVREDPALESELVKLTRASRVLLVSSGGCTAFTLLAEHENIDVTVFDINPAQLDLVRDKRALLAQGRNPPDALLQSGEFESLFRSLRTFLLEFVTDEATLDALCSPISLETRNGLAESVCVHAYWNTAFDLFFSDSMLNTMFGPAATQHAVKGSYPRYFSDVMARALRDQGTASNPFMHHILLGRYKPDALPAYFNRPSKGGTLNPVLGTLSSVPVDKPFDVVSLSNLCDWMSVEERKELARETEKRLARDGMLVLRQLNNASDVGALFPFVAWDDSLSQRWLPMERSRFYSRILIGRRRA